MADTRICQFGASIHFEQGATRFNQAIPRRLAVPVAAAQPKEASFRARRPVLMFSPDLSNALGASR